MRRPEERQEGRKTAAAFVAVLAMFAAVAWIEEPVEYSKDPVVASTAGEQDCVAGGDDLKLESVNWSRGRLTVDASHFFTKGAYRPVKPMYTLNGRHLHIGWTWALPPDLPDAACRARHRIHVEIRGLRQGRYAVHLEPIVSMN